MFVRNAKMMPKDIVWESFFAPAVAVMPMTPGTDRQPSVWCRVCKMGETRPTLRAFGRAKGPVMYPSS
eukprot:2910771-Pyramimonas_sp.AAC.2